MHAIEGTASVPAFLTKLWRLVDDPNTSDLISWTQSGRSFVIQNQAQFARELLPQYYKHNNMASFVRQLNMYGFHKVVSADSGGLRVERDDMEFAHPHFLRGQEALLENIKRKQQRRVASDGVDFSQIPTSRTVIIEENKNVSKLLGDVRDIKRDQDSMSSKLLSLKRENEALWREYANMRQKFSKQQQIIEKLIHFLIAMVKTPTKPLVTKRKFNHLALEGGDESTSSKLNSLSQFTQGKALDLVGECDGGTSGGAQIHELTETGESRSPASAASVLLPFEDSLHPGTEQGQEEAPGSVVNPVLYQFEPGTILMSSETGEPVEFISADSDSTIMPEIEAISATSVQSPEGTTILIDTNTSNKCPEALLNTAPLSPDLMHTVDPSAVTQFEPPSSSPARVQSSSSSSKSSRGKSMVAVSSNTSPSVTSSLLTSAQQGKLKAVASKEPATASDPQSSVSVIMPDKSMHKPELKTHIEDMQSSIDSLHELLTSSNFNVDPSMLLSQVFGSDDYLPELDSMSSVTSGNELSLYNPCLMDLAGDVEEEDDPLSFLNRNPPTTQAPSTSTATPAPSTSIPANKTIKPPQPKHLKLNIKREPEERIESSLETPVVSPAPSPYFRGKRRTN